MGKYIGIDFGDKRIGIAVTNDDKNFVLPRDTVDNKKIFDYLKDLTASEEIEKIVVGLPLNSAGQDTAQTKKVRQFIERLKQLFTVDIAEQDERMTTKASIQLLKGLNLKSKKKKKIDQNAAMLILQDYLARHA